MDKRFDLLVVLFGVALVGWGAYEIYPPAAKVSIGLILLGLVVMARKGN